MTPRRPRVRTAVVCSLVGITLLAGCSSDDTGTETGDESSTTGAEDVSTTTTVATSSTTDGSTTSTAPAPVAATAVEVKDYEFTPPAIRVAIGDTVTWTNGDDFAHTSTSDSDAWDTGPIEPGASATHTFTEAGAFAYFCNIHNYMQGQVVVE